MSEHILDIMDMYGQDDYAGVLEHRERWLMKRRLGLQASNETVVAYVSANRWVAMCPWCDGGIALLPGNPEAVCLGCGRVYRVIFPTAGELKKGVAALLLRPWRNRNWFLQRGEKAAGLVRENEQHGIKG